MAKKFGIIGAMEVEVATLKEKMTITRTITKADMEFCEGKIGETEVVVVQCGVGKVNAGMCVQILSDLFDVTHVINTGVAGSLDARIDIGDIVLSTDACYHDVDVTIFGYAKGQVPGMPKREFVADEWMRAKAKAAIEAAGTGVHVFEGRVVSGDQFIANDDVKADIIKEFNGMCTEMEGTAIAHACTLNHLPFVIVRAISDKADGSGSVDYPTFEKKAAADCAALVEYMMLHIED